MAKTFLLDQYKLPVDVRKDGDGFLAVSPGWEDCYAQGDTAEEAISELVAVASSLVELYREEKLRIPLEISKKAISSENLSFNLPLIVSAN